MSDSCLEGASISCQVRDADGFKAGFCHSCLAQNRYFKHSPPALSLVVAVGATPTANKLFSVPVTDFGPYAWDHIVPRPHVEVGLPVEMLSVLPIMAGF